MVYFLERFKNKTKEELENIVASYQTYDRRAVQAAMDLLLIKFGQYFPTPIPQPTTKSRKVADDEIDYKYFKVFSYREVLSAITVAFLFMAFFKLLTYYSNEYWIKDNFTLLFFVLFILCLPLNHIYYKWEHKRRNLIIGRIMQAGMSMVFVYLLLEIESWNNGYTRTFDSSWIVEIIVWILIILFCEGVASLVRRLLTLFKWQAW